MSFMGTIVNVITILVGSFLGLFLRKGLPEKWQETIMQGIGLCVCVIGLEMALKTNNIMVVIVSMVIGGILGEALEIEELLNGFGNYIGRTLTKKEQGSTKDSAAIIGEGFVAASLVFCVGAMAIVGSFQDGLLGDSTTLYAKATLDGIASIVFAANMGVGVMLSALSVGVYQGFLTLAASFLSPVISEPMMTEITATGGLLIVAIGLNMLKIVKIRIGNLIPAMVIAGIVAKFFL